MARPLRLDFEGALWHVTARGNERKPIVRDDVDRETFVRILASVVSRFDWILHGWVLMSNHYHLLVETPQPTLSRGMRHLGGVYSQAFNRRWKRAGHLFQGRFFSLHVERDSHLLELVRYTVLNPVRAGLVSHPAKWKWSSYRATAGLQKAPPWLETRWTLEQFKGRVREEKAFELFTTDRSNYSPWRSITHQVYLGGEEFLSSVRRRAKPNDRTTGIAAKQLNVGAISLDHAARRLSPFLAAHRKGLTPDVDDRALAALLLRDASLATYSRIGALSGLTVWGARSLVDRGRRLTAGKKAARARYSVLLQLAGGEHKTQN